MILKKLFVAYLFTLCPLFGLVGLSQEKEPAVVDAASVAEATAKADKPVPTKKTRLAPDDAKIVADAKNTTSVNFMLRGYCYASSSVKDKQALGGFGGSDNFAKKISKEAAKSSGEWYLLAQPTVVTDFGSAKGMRLVLVNGTDETVSFDACDSRLSIIQEAKDESGEWKPIEYLPSSWCGNSYHQLMLASGEFWAFPAPRYEGSFKTKLRFRLDGEDGDKPIVSNEFDGKINPAQFSEQQPHNPSGLMDPYDPVPAEKADAGSELTSDKQPMSRSVFCESDKIKRGPMPTDSMSWQKI